jgi:hypothetical protein
MSPELLATPVSLKLIAHSSYSANGIRTRVWALRGPRPSPLDDSALLAIGYGLLGQNLGPKQIAHVIED